MDMDGPWSCVKVSPDQYYRILERLKELERLTWKEIVTNPGHSHNHHYMDQSVICGEAKGRLEALQIDVERVFSIRITSKERLWGIREAACFRILWWDPDHSVYPVAKP
jgi:hypothetical protein